MPRQREPFGLFQKKLACGKKFYYYTTYDSEGHRRQFSTGETDQKVALREVLGRSQEGRLVPNDRLLFGTWTEDWFLYEKCPFIQSRLKRGFSYSRVHSDNRRAYLMTYLWPTFQQKHLSAIRTLDIENWTSKLLQQGRSRDLINRCLGTLKIILGEAVRLGLLSKNPAKSVLPLKHDSSEKGILTDEESQELFALKNRDRLWGTQQIAYWAHLVAYLAGLRQGELIGLQLDDLDDKGIHVRHGWDRKSGLKGTKNGKDRFVPLPTWVLLKLKSLTGKGHIFSVQLDGKPVSPTYLNSAYCEALISLGISRSQQISRHLSGHSLRHGFVSNLLARGVPATVVAQVVGHNSLEMTTKTYHHTTPLHSQSILAYQDEKVGSWNTPESCLRIVS